MSLLEPKTYKSKSGEWKIKVINEKKRWLYQIQPFDNEFNGIFTRATKNEIIETIVFYTNKL